MAIETGKEDDLSGSPLSLSQLETLRLGQGVGRSRKGPETSGPGLIVGSFVLCMAFGHL